MPQSASSMAYVWSRPSYDPATQTLHVEWQVEQPLDLPPMPLISNPPPPGVYAGPRLAVFAQLQDDARRIPGR